MFQKSNDDQVASLKHSKSMPYGISRCSQDHEFAQEDSGYRPAVAEASYRIKAATFDDSHLSTNARGGRFRYDHDFLMQFMHIREEKPSTVPALDVLGIEPVD